MKGYLIGMDVGTSSTKAVLFDLEARPIGKQSCQTMLSRPEPGAAEQDADDILRAIAQSMSNLFDAHDLKPTQIRGVAFSSAMHTLLLVDQDHHPLSPLYTWADNRCEQQLGHQPGTFRTLLEEASLLLYERTGLPLHPMNPAVKLAWLRHSQPELYERGHRVVSIKEYVLFHLCGQWRVDSAIACASGLVTHPSNASDPNQFKWDSHLLDLLGLDASQLSPLVDAVHSLPYNPTDHCPALPLAKGTPIVVGANDGVLSNLGMGAIDADTAAVTIGTSGAIRRRLNQPKLSAGAQLFCYPLTADYWFSGGAVNNGGVVLQWARDRLIPYSKGEYLPEPSSSTYAQLNAQASQISPGSDGLIFHPFLLGERAPLWDSQARASFVGLGHEHTQAHLVRAMMEGILYNLHSVFRELETATGQISHLRAGGGFAQSSLWPQMLADIFNRPVAVPEVGDSSAQGAAMLLLVALGQWDSLEQMSDTSERTYQPVPANVEQYQNILPLYEKLLSQLKESYSMLQQACL